MKDLEIDCYWFREGAIRKRDQLVREWIDRQVERGANVVPNEVELVNPKKLLTFPRGVDVPERLEIEGEFECLEPSCPTKGAIRTAYPQHNTSGFLPDQNDTYYAAYDPTRKLYYEVEVVNDECTPLCQTEEYKEKRSKRLAELRLKAQKRKQERLAREKE